MDKVKTRVDAILRFLGISLGIGLGLFAAVSLSCLVGTRCTAVMWSERMFWVSMVPLVLGMGGMIGRLGSGRPPAKPKDSHVNDEAENEAACDPGDPTCSAGLSDVEGYGVPEQNPMGEESKGLGQTARFALLMLTVGVSGFIISALIEVVSR